MARTVFARFSTQWIERTVFDCDCDHPESYSKAIGRFLGVIPDHAHAIDEIAL